MATYSTENIGTGGLAATYRAASASDKVAPGDGTFLHVKNGSATVALTVTLVTPGTVDGLPVGDRAVSVPVSADRFIAVPENPYMNYTDGLAEIQFSATASVTFAVLRA